MEIISKIPAGKVGHLPPNASADMPPVKNVQGRILVSGE